MKGTFPLLLPVAVYLVAFGGFAGGQIFAQDSEEKTAALAVDADKAERRVEGVPTDAKAWAQLVSARLEGHDNARAAKALERWRAAIPNPSPEFLQAEGEIAFARDDFPAAITAWQRYTEVRPDDASGWNRLATAYGRARDWGKSADAFSRELKIASRAASFIHRARCRIRLHDWAAAENDVREGNRIDATDAEVRKLFPIFERSRDWLPAVKKLDAAVRANPSDPALLLDRAEALFSEGLIAAGRDDLDAALKLRPDSLRARFWNGALAWDRKERDKAGAVMEFKEDDFPPQARARLKMLDAEPPGEARAEFLLKLKQPLLALEEASKVDGSPSKALALVELKRWAEARPAAVRAVEMHPSDAGAWLALARVELQNGNAREAVEAATRSEKLKKSPEADRVRNEARGLLGK